MNQPNAVAASFRLGGPTTALARLNRREFIAATAAVAVASSITTDAAETKSPALIDTNVSLSRWPFRRCPLDDTPSLVAKLRGHNVTQAWAGTFDALLHKDLSSANARLADECRRHGKGILVPIGALNPTLPNWEEDLRRCAEQHKMPGVRLHPNFHGYKLDDPLFERALVAATERRLLVQISLGEEDDRTQSALAKAPSADAAPLAAILKQFPKARVQVLNAFRTLRGKPVLDLAAVGARFEIATLEIVAGVGELLKQIPPDRLCFGSHAPFYYFESAKLKLQESDLTPAQLAALSHDNARKLLTV
ncbi:MAG: amidohydrolase family protein [Verrucomicrobia bacterium]|nr:amidohydrolase family protein [Verrucomicrobiota bacterium]